MTKLVVEENVPRQKSVPEQLGDLKPGQSAFISEDLMTPDSVQTTVWRIRSKFKGEGRVYRTAQQEEDGVRGTRVWRDEDKAEGDQ
jgi:hypothetical protein